MISRNLILLIIGLTALCHSKVIINIRIYNYANGGDIQSNGRKCENFHWLNDHCDPMFDVCITSRYKCDVLNHFIDHWNNKKYVYNVMSKTILLDHIQRSLTVDVKVEDHDRYDAHDHIAMFSSYFYITKLNKDYHNQMSVTPSWLKVHLFANIRMSCEKQYYGPDCERYCRPKPRNYDCNSSGRQICVLNCGDHGSCLWKVENDEFYCQCHDDWTGDSCQFKHYSDCSLISQRKTCTKNYLYIYCTWTDGVHVVTCQELLTKYTRPIEPVATTSLEPTEAATTATRASLPTTKWTEAASTMTNTTNQISTNTAVIVTQSTEYITPNINTKTNRVSVVIKAINNLNRRSKGNHENRANDKPSEESLKQQFASPQQHPYNSTIIIICLTLLLCVSIIVSLICALRRRENERFVVHTYTQGNLSPVVYMSRKHHNKIKSSVLLRPSLPEIPQMKYNNCTIQTDYTYDDINIKSGTVKYINNESVYDETISNNMDIMTCETDIVEGTGSDSDEYEVPTKIIKT